MHAPELFDQELLVAFVPVAFALRSAADTAAPQTEQTGAAPVALSGTTVLIVCYGLLGFPSPTVGMDPRTGIRLTG
jgi:hypothetical protein